MARMGKAAVLLLRLLGPTTGSVPTAAWSEHPTSSMGSMLRAPDAARANRSSPSSTPTPSSSRTTTKEGAAKGGKPEAKGAKGKGGKGGHETASVRKVRELQEEREEAANQKKINSWKPRRRRSSGEQQEQMMRQLQRRTRASLMWQRSTRSWRRGKKTSRRGTPDSRKESKALPTTTRQSRSGKSRRSHRGVQNPVA